MFNMDELSNDEVTQSDINVVYMLRTSILLINSTCLNEIIIH